MHRAAARRAGRPDGRDRITAEAVPTPPDALPINDILRADHAGRAGAAAARPAGARTARAVVDVLGPDRLPTTVARELYRGDRPPAGAATTTASGRRSPRSAILDGLDEETPGARPGAVSRPGPNPRELGDRAVAYEIERLTLELEDDRVQERSDFNRDAQPRPSATRTARRSTG